VVVTEDVGTFMAAVTLVPDHRGVVFCHHRRFPRTPTGLVDLSRALAALAAAPPPGLGEAPVIWWLGAPSRRSTRSPDTEIGERPVCADPRKPKTPPVGPVK
jgi:hypothetical protein